MCEPTTIMLAISAVSAVSAVAAQKQAADAQSDANERQYQNTLAARSENSNQINLNRNQQAQLAGQKINANNTAMREAQANVVAQAGPSGLSVDNLLAHIAQKGATYNESVNENYTRVNQALDNQLTNVNRSASTEINSLKTPAQPDYLGTALKIGGQAYGSGVFNTPDTTKTLTTGDFARMDRGQS